jgi:DNA-binding beta-propeller fold protein YncE
MISPAGTEWIVSTIGGKAGEFGAVDGVGSEARFKKPFGITVDAAGVLYVADFSNNTIRRGTPISGSPTIQLLNSSGQFFLAWPVTATNFEMKTSKTLSPGETWQVITEGITVWGNNFILPMVPNAPSAFYRLQQK